MRIALFTDGIYPYVIGGMQKHSFNLALHLVRNGVDVDIYHFNQSDKDINRLELFNTTEQQRIRSFIIPFPDSGKLPGHYLRESFEYSKRILSEFVKHGEVDYIYSKGFTAWALLDEKRKGKYFPPVGVNFHGFEMFQEAGSFKSKLEQYLLRGPVKFLVSHADQVFSYGGKITEIIRNLGVNDKKIIEMPSGIEQGWLKEGAALSSSKRKFLYVGRYERRKGIEELNEVLRDLKAADFEFVFVGDIPESKKIEKEGISYVGSVASPELMKSYLGKADVLVCPSHSEGMPNVILEAMANGLAIIATDVGAVALMVDDSNGWLISVHSKKELSNAIASAISMPSVELDFKKDSSLNKVRSQFLWDQLILKMVDKISEIVRSESTLVKRR
jgi:glycosyltransferase involved in cell wall biosynthesis